jgi:hypothetical protein
VTGSTTAETRLPSGLVLAIAALLPGVAWMALLFFGSQLDEDMCLTGAAPHSGRWFGSSIRLPLLLLAAFVLVVTVAAVVVLARGWRAARRLTGRSAEMRVFTSFVGLLSVGLFVPILAGTIVEILVFRRC